MIVMMGLLTREWKMTAKIMRKRKRKKKKTRNLRGKERELSDKRRRRVGDQRDDMPRRGACPSSR